MRSKSASVAASTAAGANATSTRLSSTSRSPGMPTTTTSRVPSRCVSARTTFFSVCAAVHSPSAGASQVGVRVIDQRLDRRGVRGVEDHGIRQTVERDRLGRDRRERLDVRRVAAGRAHERVLADGDRVQELLAARTAHEPVVGRDDHVLEAEALEDALVRVALPPVRGIQPLVGVVERVGVLHRELATAQEAGAGTRLVAVLVLDLVDRQRQVLVRRVQVLHEEREHLLVRRREQVVGALRSCRRKIPSPYDVQRPDASYGLTRQQRREVHLVRAGVRHLVADDALDLRLDPQPERQPREDAGRLRGGCSRRARAGDGS